MMPILSNRYISMMRRMNRILSRNSMTVLGWIVHYFVGLFWLWNLCKNRCVWDWFLGFSESLLKTDHLSSIIKLQICHRKGCKKRFPKVNSSVRWSLWSRSTKKWRSTQCWTLLSSCANRWISNLFNRSNYFLSQSTKWYIKFISPVVLFLKSSRTVTLSSWISTKMWWTFTLWKPAKSPQSTINLWTDLRSIWKSSKKQRFCALPSVDITLSRLLFIHIKTSSRGWDRSFSKKSYAIEILIEDKIRPSSFNSTTSRRSH